MSTRSPTFIANIYKFDKATNQLFIREDMGDVSMK